MMIKANRKEVESYKKLSHVIELDDEKVLKLSKYNEYRSMLTFDGSIG